MYKKSFFTTFIIIFVILILSTTSFASSLHFGDKGKDVKKIQKILYNLGYDLLVDGIYGHRTENVVKSFQLNNKLKVDGKVGKQTLKILKERSEEIKYIVKKGDILSKLAHKFETSIKDIKKKNNLSSNLITIGQKLLIPKTGIGGGEEKRLYSNIIHEVQPSDSLYTLAQKYGTNIKTIKLANNLNQNKIYIGQNLVIPHISDSTSSSFCLTKRAFIWPVIGRISSDYGWRSHPLSNKQEFHKGIDISVPLGKEIRAAAAGKIIQSGWIKGFGKTVIIYHGNNVETLYAHNSKLIVRNGDKVNIGDVIALAGSTGLSTGSHLHFGLLVKDKAINPQKYLP